MPAPTVVLASGHMVDSPDRASPRFPPAQVDRVTHEIAAVFERWAVGPATTVICGGARGADLIAAEQALARGARVMLCLALPADEFRRRSVELPGTDWAERFHRVAAAAEVRAPAEASPDPFARANVAMTELARGLDAAPHVLLVWNGAAGDGPGGTRDMVRRLGVDRPHPRVHVVDPTPRAYESRQRPDGPKRLLALDGGGMRGALSLEILDAIESGLRARYGRPDLVLADFFDHIAGTSTGAIIATALALGHPVDEIRRRYQTLGKIVFRKRLLPMRARSFYLSRPLRQELTEFFGADCTLGDPRLRTLLMIVLHNTATDSPWILSNCTAARFNRADRNLLDRPDRNLDIPLAPLVRASTAAPVYFLPEELAVGEHRFLFQDGGVTPFNNPALAQIFQATLPEYGLGWPSGERSLLLVSVGAGSSAAVHPGLRRNRVTWAFNARNLPAVFMNGASVGQDLACRALGRCRHGLPIDEELGTLQQTSGVSRQPLFSYVRYDADLSDPALIESGVSDPRVRKRVRKLDAVEQLPLLQRLGRDVGRRVDVAEHFAGFLDRSAGQ